jgi:hypothetical protein
MADLRNSVLDASDRRSNAPAGISQLPDAHHEQVLKTSGSSRSD